MYRYDFFLWLDNYSSEGKGTSIRFVCVICGFEEDIICLLMTQCLDLLCGNCWGSFNNDFHYLVFS